MEGGSRMNQTPTPEELFGCTAAVVGLGVSNRPLVDFLLLHGARVVGRDKKTRAELGHYADELEARGVRLILGDAYLEELTESVIFRSPGLRPDLPQFVRAVENGAVLTSEMELFLSLTPATVIGVTGSDGKTTSTTLTGLFLEEECRKEGRGRVYMGGNLGQPLLPFVAEMRAEDFAVVELSSFQLQSIRHSPHISAITNITPNHQDWHRGMEEYSRAKQQIFAHAPARRVILNAENDITREIGMNTALPVTWFSSAKSALAEFDLRPGDHAVFLQDGAIVLSDGEETTPMLDAKELLLPGRHNLENCMTAIALTEGLVGKASIRCVATSFRGVAHRLEAVCEADGVLYYNSSIDSTPTRTAAALSALPKKPIVICGGYDKKVSFAPLAEALVKDAKAVVLTGATAPLIRAALDATETVREGKLPIYHDADFEGAVRLAHDVAEKGDIVLLSPACASFDAFPDFTARGDAFRRICRSFLRKEV